MEKIFSAIPFYYGATKEAPNCLGSAQANGHLLAFSWEKQEIYLDVFHGLSDAGGLLPLLRTVMYYYCQEKYRVSLNSQGIRLAGEEIPKEEIEEPYPDSVDESVRPIGKATRQTALNLAKAGLCHPGKSMHFRIQIPEDAYMRYSRDKDGSPAAVTALLMARAIDGVHWDQELPIVCGMAMNTRKVLGKPLSHHSLVSQLFLEYKEAMKKMDIREQAVCFRGMIMVQGQAENVLDSVRNNIRLFRQVETILDLQSRRKMLQQVVSSFLDVDTFKVSYVGRSCMGAAETYIQSIYTQVDLNGSGIMLEINSVNGKFCLSFLQEWEDDIYVKAFLRQLDQEGIPYTLAGKEALQAASVEIGG